MCVKLCSTFLKLFYWLSDLLGDNLSTRKLKNATFVLVIFKDVGVKLNGEKIHVLSVECRNNS